MLDGLFELISSLLNFFYELVPNYAVAIALLTCAVMLVTTPLTMKGTRSMIEMQRLQPEIRRIQQEYKDDRQKMNEEMMRFYRENQINPLGGCLPLLVQAPVFAVLFWVVRGLTNSANFVGVQNALDSYGINATTTEGFKPKYLDQSAELYQALLGQGEMLSFGVDLALSPGEALQQGFVTAIPYLMLVGLVAGLSWLQQKQIMGRTPASQMTQQQRMMMRVVPIMLPFFTFAVPAALGVYFLVSTVWRVGQQGYITRSLYRGEDSVGAQAQKAMAQVRAERNKDGARAGGSGTNGKSKRTVSGDGAAQPNAQGKTADTTASAATTNTKTRPHPRSRKKKKRKH
jgi:YidC/Oxa1 family membrane protein insertase